MVDVSGSQRPIGRRCRMNEPRIHDMDTLGARVYGFLSGLAASLLLAAAASAADPAVTATIEPAEVSLGEAASLTITASDGNARINPPSVPGLQFTQVAQSRSLQSVNGVTRSSVSVTYQVIAQQAGTYVISSIAPGVGPLTFKVDPGATGQGAQRRQGVQPGLGAQSGQPAQPPASDSPPAAPDGTAFVRVVLPRQEIYVGQSVPVDIEVGTQDGVVASINGVPTLNGDAFTLDKLAAEPEQRSHEVIDGKPFTVFTWHSVLSAVKPGRFTFTVQAPMTVRVRMQRPGGVFGGSGFADLFNDPGLANFFAATVNKDVNVSSPATSCMVLDLPAEGRPGDFTGAVGQFKLSSELSENKVTAGDPLTLRMKVSGQGNFDRVRSPMLGDADHWKLYPTTSKFSPVDHSSFRGDKTFEQPVVPTDPGRQTLPGLRFSFFDPDERRYETARTDPLTVDVSPPATAATARADGGAPAPVPAAAPNGALRPDHSPQGSRGNSLVPHYFQPRYLALPSLMLLALAGAWFWLSRRERRAQGAGGARDARLIEPARLAAAMDRATAADNVPEFFHAARAGLQNALAKRWRLPPEAVTLEEVDARLGAQSDARKIFVLADEALYSGRRFARSELNDWKRVVLRQMGQETAS
jgi:hypothetical protein